LLIVSVDRGQLAPRDRVPELDGAVGTARRQYGAVRREGHRSDRLRITFESLEFPPGASVPHLHFERSAAGGHFFAVGREGGREDGVRMRQRETVAVEKPPEVIPLEAAQIFLSRAWRMALDQFAHP